MSRVSRAIPRKRTTVTTSILALAACGGLVAAMASPANAHPAPTATVKAAHPAAKPAALVSGYKEVKLVSDQKGRAQLHDKKLLNAWGLALGPTTPLWVANNHSASATVYSGGGVGHPITNVGLVVTIPGGSPTGQVFNGTNGFKLKNGMPAKFIFDSESGLVTAWNGSLTPSTKAVTVSSTANGNFKGLALLKTKGTEYLLLADFRHNKIEILNSKFAKVSFGTTAFHDAKLPAGYAPFNVAVIGTRVYVSYAKQDKAKDDDSKGAHRGYVDVYSTRGTLIKRLIKGGALNSPWGLTLAPAGFGKFHGSLLVGNFGDGLIHAYSPSTGAFRGTLKTPAGATIKIPGLWALLPGNGTAGARSDIWFSAGPSVELHGLLGILRAA